MGSAFLLSVGGRLRIIVQYPLLISNSFNFQRSRWLGEHLQVLVVLLVALVQVILCVSWLVAAPPRVIQNYVSCFYELLLSVGYENTLIYHIARQSIGFTYGYRL